MKGKKGIFKNPLTVFKFFPRRLINGGIFNNRVLFENNKLLFLYCFLKNFCGGQGFDGGDKVVMGQGFPSGETEGGISYLNTQQ